MKLDLLDPENGRLMPEPNSGCLLWTGAMSGDYGQWGDDYVHRIAWSRRHGPIPPGVQVLHRCDVPPCVNDAHLFTGSITDNMADKMAKGRHRWGNTFGEDHPHHKLTVEQVREIRASTTPLSDCAAFYDIDRTLVWQIRTRRAWKWLDADC